MRIVVFVLFSLIAGLPTSVAAEMDEEVILRAKEHIAALNMEPLRQTLVSVLVKRGTPAEEHSGIVLKVVREIASCIVDGLEADSSLMSQAAILVISDGADFEDGKTYFERVYTEAEIDEYGESYMKISAICNLAVLQKNYLIAR